MFLRKKIEAGAANQNVSTGSSLKGSSAVKRKRAVVPKKPPNTSHLVSVNFIVPMGISKNLSIDEHHYQWVAVGHHKK